MRKNVFLVAMLGMVLGLGLMGCASTKFTRSDPLAVEQKGDYAVLRVQSTVKNVLPFAKIDGVGLESNEILLPAGTTEYDVKFIVNGNWHKFVIQANVPLPMEAGTTYLLAADLTPANRAAHLLISLLPYEYQFELYEYSSDLKTKTKLNTFVPVNLEMKDF